MGNPHTWYSVRFNWNFCLAAHNWPWVLPWTSLNRFSDSLFLIFPWIERRFLAGVKIPILWYTTCEIISSPQKTVKFPSPVQHHACYAVWIFHWANNNVVSISTQFHRFNAVARLREIAFCSFSAKTPMLLEQKHAHKHLISCSAVRVVDALFTENSLFLQLAGVWWMAGAAATPHRGVSSTPTSGRQWPWHRRH